MENKGELVNRPDFIEIIWEGNYLVGEKALTRNVSRLRALLKKHQLEQQLDIKTIAKKGYLLQLPKKHQQRRIAVLDKANNNFLSSHPQLLIALGILLLFIFILGRRTAGNPITVTLSRNSCWLDFGKLTVSHVGRVGYSIIYLICNVLPWNSFG